MADSSPPTPPPADDLAAEGSSEPPAGTSPSQYRLSVTAGPGYDPKDHETVEPNSATPYTIDTEHLTLIYSIRIAHFSGLPSTAPTTSPYFSDPAHTTDQYSISVAFIPKHDIIGSDLLFGNDFDRPIASRLPPGFNQALKFVKWWIDPGLEGDVYSEKPYLYGPALSSWNTFAIGDKIVNPDRHDMNAEFKIPDTISKDFGGEYIVSEGRNEDLEDSNDDSASPQIPSDAAARKKHFLTETNRDAFTFEKGRLYQADFFNGYLDFNDFSLKLPYFSMNVIQYLSKENHELRYVLKDKKTGECYAAWVFTLVWGEEREKIEEELKHEEEEKKLGAEKKVDDDNDVPDDDDDVD